MTTFTRRRSGPPILLLAGGPGQSASSVYATENLFFDPLDPFLFLGRDMIVFDQRGTGQSGLLRCPQLERAELDEATTAAESCAAQLGARRSFYRTADSVEDIEAIRMALGTRRVALAGTSYGTKVALAYALRYPERVDRLVLDSTVAADGPDPLMLDSLAAIPRVLRSLCRGSCRRVTPDPVHDLEAFAARLAVAPLEGRVVTPSGRARPVRLSGVELLAMALSSSLPLSELPGAVRSAVLGDPASLLRLKQRMAAAQPAPPRALSAAVFAATICEDAPLPWPRVAAIADRPAHATAVAAALPDEAFAPFDRSTLLENSILDVCRNWPLAPDPPTVGTGPLPDVPVLFLAGQLDLRTPLETARRTAAKFPHAQVYVARGVGHSVLGSDGLFGCSEEAVGRFFKGRRLPRCPYFGTAVEPRAPTSLRELRPARGVGGRRGRELTAVRRTLADVLNDAFARLVNGSADLEGQMGGGGLRGGSYRLNLMRGELRLRRLEFVPGVRITGAIHRLGGRRQRGRLRIRGPAAPAGTLTLKGRRVRGRLAGRPLSMRLSLLAAAAPGAARALAASASHRADEHPPPTPDRFTELARAVREARRLSADTPSWAWQSR
jgi:pimeloyl-ACP methyl ester carboxylesterase